MKSLEERLNNRLEQIRSQVGQNGQNPRAFLQAELERESDLEVEDLVDLARRLQTTPHIQVDPDFAQQLERRVLRRYAELQIQTTDKKRSFRFLFRAHPAFYTILGLCLLFLLLGTGLLVMAAH